MESAAEFADGIEIALEVGKRKIARRIVETLFARFAGRANREHTRLDRFNVLARLSGEAIQAIVAANFEQACVALAVIEIPFDRACHGHDAGRTQHVRFFRERIGKPRGRNVAGTEQRVALFGNVRNRQDFAIAKTDEPLAQTRFRFVVWKASRALASRRQTWRKFIEAVNTRNLFDQIDFALDFGAPGRLRAFPRSEKRTFRAAVLIASHRRETERAEAGFDLLVRNIRAHHAKNFSARHADFYRGALAGIDIDNAGE